MLLKPESDDLSQETLMKRKERKPLYRILNAISSLVLIFSCVYLYFWGLSFVAIMGAFSSVCCIGGPVAFAGDGGIEIIIGIAEALLHALIDAVIGIFEAIASVFSSVG